MSYIIGVDCGTSGTKTVLFDELGTVVASHTIEYPMYQPKNGYAEQDPNDWASAMIDTIKAVMAKSGVKKENVKGIGISGRCTVSLCLIRIITYSENQLFGAIRGQPTKSLK